MFSNVSEFIGIYNFNMWKSQYVGICSFSMCKKHIGFLNRRCSTGLWDMGTCIVIGDILDDQGIGVLVLARLLTVSTTSRTVLGPILHPVLVMHNKRSV